MKWIGWVLCLISVGMYFGVNQGGAKEITDERTRAKSIIKAEREKIDTALEKMQRQEEKADSAIDDRAARLVTHSDSKATAAEQVAAETSTISDASTKLTMLNESNGALSASEEENTARIAAAKARIPALTKDINLLKKHVPDVVAKK